MREERTSISYRFPTSWWQIARNLMLFEELPKWLLHNLHNKMGEPSTSSSEELGCSVISRLEFSEAGPLPNTP
jgi:hypothetical protein